ncbi:MAG: YfhO family protein [Ardenticatenaceae bacterium]|nr:YfhO family protein [Ardenticatenaceae bacterium]
MATRIMVRQNTLLAGGLLFGASLVLLRGWLGDGLPLTPRREMLAQMAWAGLVADGLRHGQLFAEWSPWYLGGQPWTRLLSVPVYYLVALLSFLPGFSLASAVKLFYVLAFTFSGWSMYVWVRSLRLSAGAAILAAIAYMYFPFHAQAGADWWEHLLVWALLPLPLALVERWRWTWSPWRGAWFGLAVGALVLVNPERAPHTAFLLALYILGRELPGWRAGRDVARRSLTAFAFTGLVAALLAAPVLVAVLRSLPDLGASAMRGKGAALTSEFLRGWSLTPGLLAAAVLRRAQLSPATASLPTIWKAFGGLNAWYLGVVLLGLACLSLWQAWRDRARRSLIGLLWALALLALLIGVSPWVPGDPFHLLFARVLPYRAMFYLGLTLPALAAFGADWLLGIVERRFWWQPPSALAQAAGPLFFGAFVLLVFVDFHPVSGTYTSTPRYFTAEEYEAYAWLAAKQTSGPWRIWEPTDDITLKYQRTLAPTFAPVPRYDGHWDEGVPLPMWSLRHEATDLLDPDLLNALAVRYIVLRPAEPGAERWQTELAAAGFNSLAWERGGVQIWENPATPPFAWSAGTVRALSYRPGHIRLVVEHEIAGPVRVAEAWFPDWQVTVDGQPARLLRADEAFLGVEIPPGRHEVVFFWQTPAVIWLSWALAGFALAGLIGGGVYTWIQRRRSSFR